MRKTSTSGNHAPFSFFRLFSKSISSALNVHALLLQGMTLALSLLAFVLFTAFMGMTVFLTSILSIASGVFPVAIFVMLFGFAIWILGLLAINAFANGVQFHLVMQAVSKRPLDINLAWKLSSARWKDAFVVQGAVLGFIVSMFILSLIVSLIVSGSAQWALVLLNPSSWSSAGWITVLIVGGLVVLLQPFFMMLLPITYFDSVSPSHVVERLRKQVRPHYIQLLATLVLLVALNMIVSAISDTVVSLPFSSSTINDTAATFVMFSAFALLVQVLTVLITFTINLHTQTLLYLHIAPPKEHVPFVTKGTVSTALSRMAHSHPSHSGMLPVKWKTPGGSAKRKAR